MDSEVFGRVLKGALIGIVLGLLGGVLLSVVIDFFKRDSNKDENQAEYLVEDRTGLEEKILRFHIKANSNSAEDIMLKYVVRDEVLNAIGKEISECDVKDEVEEYLEENLDYIEEIAQRMVYSEGYGYDVNAYVKEDYFPIRQYGEVVLPAGRYKALEIDIGDALGENFWCMLYPMMCFTMDSAAVISREGEENLRREISDEEYEKLFVKHDVSDMDIEVKFKLAEWLENTLFNLFE